MKKSIYIIIAILIIGGGLGLYVVLQKDGDDTPSTNAVANTTTASTNTASTNTTTDEPTTYIGDGFTMLQLAGWVQGDIAGTIVSFYPEHEQQPEGSTAAAIHFQSYIAVSADLTNGQSLDDVYQQTVSDIANAIDEVTIFATSDETVDGVAAKFAAMEFNQQDVDYTVLVAVYYADDQYYVVTCNTTSAQWPEYKDSLYEVVRSFALKSQ